MVSPERLEMQAARSKGLVCEESTGEKGENQIRRVGRSGIEGKEKARRWRALLHIEMMRGGWGSHRTLMVVMLPLPAIPSDVAFPGDGAPRARNRYRLGNVPWS
jgi:hypothetical protein